MVIYIYGNSSFKKEIHSILSHANIKFRLDEHGEIKDLNSIDELKEAIEDNPNNIYLIDDAKIIKKNSLNQKISFLKPKDGIEQEYLLDNGIGDVSVDSLDELAKHIIKRLEAVIHEKESNDIQESIVEMVEEAYEEDENAEKREYVQLDDELSALLSHEEDSTQKEEETQQEDEELDSLLQDSFDETIEPMNNNSMPSDDEFDSLISMIDDKKEESKPLEEDDEFNSLISMLGDEDENKSTNSEEDLSFEEDLDNILNITDDLVEEKEEVNIPETKSIEENNQGESMADEFAEFDNLNEDDILAALNDMDMGEVSTPVKAEPNSVSPVKESSSSSESIDLSGSNVNDIAELISKLLNNKTLEITVKVKG